MFQIQNLIIQVFQKILSKARKLFKEIYFYNLEMAFNLKRSKKVASLKPRMDTKTLLLIIKSY